MRKKFFMVVFGLILIIPVICQLSSKQMESLQGVTEEKTLVNMSYQTLMRGEWQSSYETYLSDNLNVRNWLIPLRNEITYTVFKSSPNRNIVIGKNKELYEEEYIDFETQIYSAMNQSEIDELVNKLTVINNYLQGKGKELFVFITPSKAEIVSENIPDRYLMIAPKEKKTSTYDLFVSALKKTDIAYYDSTVDVRSMVDNVEYSVFPLTGTHWSDVTAAVCAQKLADSMEQQLNINLPEMKVTWQQCEEPVHPDADLYNLLNLIRKPDVIYYKSDIEVTDTNKDSLRIFARGGSFMGSSIYKLITNDFFDESYYLENTGVISSDGLCTGSFSDYSEIPVKEMLDNSDLIFLEVNEEAIPRMSFGFIDYVVDNIILGGE